MVRTVQAHEACRLSAPENRREPTDKPAGYWPLSPCVRRKCCAFPDRRIAVPTSPDLDFSAVEPNVKPMYPTIDGPFLEPRKSSETGGAAK
jgi:hypothetical protein